MKIGQVKPFCNKGELIAVLKHCLWGLVGPQLSWSETMLSINPRYPRCYTVTAL